MVGKNNAAVIANIGKISTPRVTNGRSIDFAGAVDSFLRGYDWGDNLRKQKEQEANREALALALQAEDEAQIADAWAKFDPMGYAERLDKIKEARIKREQALADAEAEHNRNIALEELRNRLGIKRDEATHSRTMALEKLKRDWSLEDKGVERQQQLEDKELERQQQLEDKELERQQQLEDADAKRQDLYTQKVFEKELEAQNKDLPLLVREQSKYEKGTRLYNLYGRAIENTIAKMNSSANANVSEKIQLLNEFRKMFPWMTDEQLVEAVQSFYNKNQTQKDTRTPEQKNYEFYIDKGLPHEDALDRASKTGKYAPNQPKPQKTPEQIFDEEMAKADAKAKVERQKNIAEYDGQIAVLEDALEQIFGDNGLALRANIGYEKPEVVGIWNRVTPTMFTDKDIQEARGALANIVGMVRLGLTEFLKGSVSNYEQQLLQDVSSGNITRYTPRQIKGALEAMSKRFKTLRDNLAGGSSEKETVKNSQKKQPSKIKSITREK